MANTTLRTRIVLRNDSTANWLANDSQVLLKGEVGIEFLESGSPKIKIGDGIKAWSELPYFGGDSELRSAKVFQVTPEGDITDEVAITNAVGATALQTGDLAIVKRAIAGDKFQYTGYAYNGTEWAAMDGNYNAENVYFAKDLITTSAIGNITLTNGQATIAAEGKNLKQVFETIFVKEKNPTVVQPSVSVSLSGAGAKEVGTKITPSYNATFNKGSYEYGPDTGLTATWAVKDTRNEEGTAAAGSFSELEVGDNTNYTITATATYGTGATPLTNIGNPYAAGAIVAGSKNGTSSAITGYRNSFYGTLTEMPEALSSATIRGLSGKANSKWTNGKTFTISIPVGAKAVIFAYPATLRDVTSVKDVNGLSAEVKSAFVKSTLSVEGANAYAGADYKVYVSEFAEAVQKANTYNVTI